MSPSLILASTSPWRRAQLDHLGLGFSTARPDVDEAPLPGEQAPALAARLAEAKARAVAAQFPGAFIIGGDQTLACGGQILGKPGDAERAFSQLCALREHGGRFHSAVCLLHPDGRADVCTVHTDVRLRRLSDAQLRTYIRREPAFDCAGSFKVEGLGISLFEHLHSDDPSALIGLPMMSLTHLLSSAGLDPLQV